MRTIVIAIVFCVVATRAFSYAALSVGTLPSGQRYGAVHEYATREDAIRESINTCATSNPGKEAYIEPCRPIAVFKNQCVAIFAKEGAARRENPKVIFAVSNTPEEALANASSLCRQSQDANSICRREQEFCDGMDPAFASSAAASPTKPYSGLSWNDVTSWWNNSVTNFGLLIAGAFTLLLFGFLYMFDRLMRERRLAANRSVHIDHRRRAEPETPSKTEEPARQPPPEPALDTRAIKEAFKSQPRRRQEFEL